MFSCRVVTADHYQAPPVTGLDVCYSDFRNAQVRQVPVVRIFGATPAGQKTCMHVHGIFPYFYVPYNGEGQAPDFYTRQFALSLDKALNVALNRATSNQQHVYKVAIVQARPFYGYYDKEQLFLKIFLLNPLMVKKAADLLLGGAVMSRVFQPYESHIPYLLQMFIDYNLYGMNMIDVAAVKFRKQELEGDVKITDAEGSDEEGRSSSATPEEDLEHKIWDEAKLPRRLLVDKSATRQSNCELEVDVVAPDILNRLEVQESMGGNPGLAGLWQDEKLRCIRQGLPVDDLQPPSSPERPSVRPSPAEQFLLEQLQDIVLQLQTHMGEETSSDEDETEFNVTPASQLLPGADSTAVSPDRASQDTVILDEEGPEAVIDELSIHRVVSSSQSFHMHSSDPSEKSVLEDQELVAMLASLAAKESQEESAQGEEAKGSQSSSSTSRTASLIVTLLEEQDSILCASQQPRSSSIGIKPGSQQEPQLYSSDDEDGVELSQLHQESEEVVGGEEEDAAGSPRFEDFDTEGLECTWNPDQEDEVGESDNDSDADLPQYDGPADNKSSEVERSKKRLGIRGPVSKGMFSVRAETASGVMTSFSSCQVQQVPLSAVQQQALSSSSSSGSESPDTSLRLDLSSSSLLSLHDHSQSKAQNKLSRTSNLGKNSPKEATDAEGLVQPLANNPRKSSPKKVQNKDAAKDNIFSSITSSMACPSAPVKPTNSDSAASAEDKRNSNMLFDPNDTSASEVEVHSDSPEASDSSFQASHTDYEGDDNEYDLSMLDNTGCDDMPVVIDLPGNNSNWIRTGVVESSKGKSKGRRTSSPNTSPRGRSPRGKSPKSKELPPLFFDDRGFSGDDEFSDAGRSPEAKNFGHSSFSSHNSSSDASVIYAHMEDCIDAVANGTSVVLPSLDGSLKKKLVRIKPKPKPKTEDDDRIWLDVSNEVQYYNSRRTTIVEQKTRHATDEFTTRVKVLKLDSHDFDMALVGKESLNLKFLDTRDIEKMKHVPCDPFAPPLPPLTKQRSKVSTETLWEETYLCTKGKPTPVVVAKAPEDFPIMKRKKKGKRNTKFAQVKNSAARRKRLALMSESSNGDSNDVSVEPEIENSSMETCDEKDETVTVENTSIETLKLSESGPADPVFDESSHTSCDEMAQESVISKDRALRLSVDSSAASSSPTRSIDPFGPQTSTDENASFSSSVTGSMSTVSSHLGDQSERFIKRRRRRKLERSDHYVYRDKRVSTNYEPDAFKHIYRLENTKEQKPENEEPKKLRRKRKPKPIIQYIIINKFKGYKSMRVKVPRLFIDVPTIKVSELKYYMKPRRLRLLERYWERRRQNKVAGRVIVSDMPLENKEDPLWEQQLQRLGDISSDDEDKLNRLLEVAERMDGETQEANGGLGKKKVASYHKRLSNAFCKTNRKPRKRTTDSRKFINTLSLLHQATLANLTDTNSAYGEKVDKDHAGPYEDVMYKLALFSPPPSEKGDLSPPVALSPPELAANKEQLKRSAQSAGASQESKSLEKTDQQQSANFQDNDYVSSPAQSFSLEDSNSRSETGCSSPKCGPPPYTVKETIVKIGSSSNSPKKTNLKLNTDIARLSSADLLSPSDDGGLSDLPSNMGPASESPTLNMPSQTFWQDCPPRKPEYNTYMHDTHSQNASHQYVPQEDRNRQMGGPYMNDRPSESQGQQVSEPLRAMEGMMSRMSDQPSYHGSDPSHHVMTSPPPIWGSLNSPPGQPFHSPRPAQHHSIPSPGYSAQHYPPPSHPGSSPHGSGFHPVYPGPPHHSQHPSQTPPSPHMMWNHPMATDRPPSRPVSAPGPYFGHSYPPPGQDPLSPLGITHGSPDGYFGNQHPLRLPPYYSPLGIHSSFHPPSYPGPTPHSNTSPMARLHGHHDSHHGSAQVPPHSSPYGPMPVSQHSVPSASKSPVHSQPVTSCHISPRGSRTPSHDSIHDQTSPVTQNWSNNQSSSGPSPVQSENRSPNQSHGSSPCAPNSVYSRSEQSPSSYSQDHSSQNTSQQQSAANVSTAKLPYPPDASPSPQYHNQQRSPTPMPYMPDSEGQNSQYMNQSNNYTHGSPSARYVPPDSQNTNSNVVYNQHHQRSPAHMHYHQDIGSPPHYPRPQPQHYGEPSHYPPDNPSPSYHYSQSPMHNYPHSMPGHSPRHGGQWISHNDPAAQQQSPAYHDQSSSYRNSNPSPTYTQLGQPAHRHSPVQCWQSNSWGNSAPTPGQRTYQRSPSHSQMPQSPSPSFNQPHSYQQAQQQIDQPSTSQASEHTTYKSTDPSLTHQQQSASPNQNDGKSYSTATDLAPQMSPFFGDSLKDPCSVRGQTNSPDKEQFKQPVNCVRRSSSSSSSGSSKRELEHIHCSSPIRSPSPATLTQASNESRDSPSTAEPEVVPSAKQSLPLQVNDVTPCQTQTNTTVKASSPKSQSAAENGSASPRNDASPPLQPGQVSVVQSPPTESSNRSDTEDSDSRPADHEVVSICSLSPMNEDASQRANCAGTGTQEPTQPSIIPLHYYGDQPGQVKGQSVAQSPDQHSSSTPNNQRQVGAKVKPLGLAYSDISDDEVASDAQRAAGHPSSPSSSSNSSSQKKTGDSDDSQSPAVSRSHYDCNMSDGLSILAAAAASKYGNDGGPAPASGDKDVDNSTGLGEANNASKQSSSSSSSMSRKTDGEDLGSSDQQPPEQQPASCSGSDEGQTKVTLQPLQPPPSHDDVQGSLLENNLPHVKPQPPFCSDPADMPARDAAVLNPTSSTLVSSLPEFEASTDSFGLARWQQHLVSMRSATTLSSQATVLCDDPVKKGHLMSPLTVVLTPVILPPSRDVVKQWLKAGKANGKSVSSETCDKTKPKGTTDKKLEDLSEISPPLSRSEKKTLPAITPQLTPERSSQTPESSTSPKNAESYPKENDEDDDVLPPTPPAKVRKTVTLLASQTSTPSHSTPSGKLRHKLSQRLPSFTPITSSGRRTSTPTAWQTTPTTTSRGVRTPKLSIRQRLSLSMQMQSQSPGVDDTVSQIQGPTPNNTYNFKVPQQNMKDAKALHEFQHITMISVEVHTNSRGTSLPDPEFDAIRAIFYSIFNDVPDQSKRHINGILIIDKNSVQPNGPGSPQPSTSMSGTASVPTLSAQSNLLHKSGYPIKDVSYFSDETEMFEHFIQLVLTWNPDFLVGYEIQKASWGYILQRAAQLNTDLATAISRLPGSKEDSHWSKEKDEYGADHQSEIHIAGRIVLNLWRILRHELALNIYTYENIVYHVLHERVPKFSHQSLSSWWNHRTSLFRWRVLEYYQKRTRDNLKILEKLDITGQTSEFARIFGIQFYHVLSRGSQYRVESMMLRIAKPMNLLPVTPSVQQRARMRAPECIPLTLEPQSAMYTDPVVVLDFQSLYPSIMIAYNYCFSTCLGRLQHLAKAQEGAFDFGCTSLNVPPRLLKKLQKHITVCPNGVAFVKQDVKKGILPIMVEEILETRFMVKKAMKKYKDDQTLTKVLHARQLGLKLIANVTFGYTSANFSGRMPCVEVGDSIVSKARETLERTIQLIEETEKWGAKVVYGDTDSVFVLLKGRTKEEAFKIGYDMVDVVSAQHPKPIKLKFEKVYLPCVLQTKKRYVGFMYETPEQKEPVFDAKGIETVRRDNCPAVAKILERSIKLLFTSRDVSEVRRYVENQCLKVLDGTANSQDLIFAKEYRGAAGYKPGACVPALNIAKKLLTTDRRAEPLVGQRVPYVIVYGLPGQPLIQLVRQPHEILLDPSLRINATYYVTKAILPPLQRIFLLLGVDVFAWYNNLPRRHKVGPQIQLADTNKKGTISQYFGSLDCRVCGNMSQTGLCPSCKDDPQMSFAVINTKISKYQRTSNNIAQVCYGCTGTWEENISCVSLDCPALFRRHRAALDARMVPQLIQLVEVMQNKQNKS